MSLQRVVVVFLDLTSSLNQQKYPVQEKRSLQCHGPLSENTQLIEFSASVKKHSGLDFPFLHSSR